MMQNRDSRVPAPETPRKPGYWAWFLGYAAVCAALLAPLYIYRVSVLKRGAFIESVPALILIVAFFLSAGVAVTLWRSDQRFVPWLLLAILCLVLTGEEASWGREAVLGRAPVLSGDKWDFHNWLPQQVGSRLAFVDVTSKVGITVVSIIGAIATSAALLTGLKMIRSAKLGLTGAFLVIAVVWTLVATTADFLDLTRVNDYDRVVIYKWAIEESAEILAVTAIAFVPLVRAYRHWRYR